MASPVSVPNTFTAATDAVAAEVNANFTSLVDYINTNMVTKDGTAAITGTQAVTNLTVSGTLTAQGNLNVDGTLKGDVVASNGSSVVLSNGTNGSDATFKGDVLNASGTTIVDVSAATFAGNATTSSSTTGNAATASKWANATTLTVDGDMTGSVVFDGSDTTETLTLTAALEAADIPNLAASKITTGTFGSGDYTFPGNLDVNGIVKVDDGSVSSPSFTFDSEENTGIYRSSATQFALTANGTIGLIVAAGTVNTAGLETVSTTGYKAVYRNNTFGTLYHFSSRAELKENITNVSASDSGAWIDALQPVTFNERWMQESAEPADNKAWREADVQVGFIADDVLANSTTARFASVEDVDGTLQAVAWKFDNVLAATVAELKSLRARMEAVEAA